MTGEAKLQELCDCDCDDAVTEAIANAKGVASELACYDRRNTFFGKMVFLLDDLESVRKKEKKQRSGEAEQRCVA